LDEVVCSASVLPHDVRDAVPLALSRAVLGARRRQEEVFWDEALDLDQVPDHVDMLLPVHAHRPQLMRSMTVGPVWLWSQMNHANAVPFLSHVGLLLAPK
jgi:hypothetical protein